MATQYQDGHFGETKPMDEAMEEFMTALEADQAKSFHVGTPEEIEKQKDEIIAGRDMTALADRVTDLERERKSPIALAVQSDIEKYS